MRSALGAKELPEGLTSLIQERTGGNPFFIEEVCHSLKAEGTVVVSEGRATLNRSLDALHIPDSVHAVIRTRVDRLNQDSQEALRLASVIGRELRRRILERMYSRRSQLLHTLEGLKIEDLILQVRVLPEVEYMFKHVLIQAVVYETLLLQRRKDLHCLVARTIEDVYADRLEERSKTLAYHYQRSTEPEKGVNYLERAGDGNRGITHSAEARRNYWEAIHVLDALEPRPERKRYRLDLNLKLASISADSAPSEEHIATLHRSIEYAPGVRGTEPARATALLAGQHALHDGPHARRTALPARKHRDDGRPADFETWSAASTVWAQIECFMGEFAQSVANFERVKPLKSKGTPIDLVANLLNGAWSYAWMGDFRHALEDNERAIEVSKTVVDKSGLAWSYCGLAITQFHRGDWQAAIDNAAQATEIGRRVGDVLETAFAVLSGGYALAMHGNPAEGLQKMQEAIHMVGSLGSTLGGTLGMAWLGEVHLALDDVEEAVKAAQTSLLSGREARGGVRSRRCGCWRGPSRGPNPRSGSRSTSTCKRACGWPRSAKRAPTWPFPLYATPKFSRRRATIVRRTIT